MKKLPQRLSGSRWRHGKTEHLNGYAAWQVVEVQQTVHGWYARLRAKTDDVTDDLKTEILSGPWENQDSAEINLLDGLRALGTPPDPMALPLGGKSL